MNMILEPSIMPSAISFLFIFAIVLGLLSSAKIFESKNVNIAIAAVFGIFSASYEPFVSAMQSFIPFISILFVVVFVIKLIGGSKKEGDAKNMGFVLVILFIVIGATWSYIADYFMIEYSTNILWLIAILIIILIFAIASKIKSK